MLVQTAEGLLIPFLGTTLGAACVFFIRRELNHKLQRALAGFAAGVMVAASIWSLILPAMDQAQEMGHSKVLPSAIGIWIGILFLLLLDTIIPHLHNNGEEAEGPKSSLTRTTKLVLAVTLHNIPEGMAVGVVYAGVMSGEVEISMTGALVLAIGIAIQNFPEGVITTLPMHTSGGAKKSKAFLYGTLSGIVEPISAVITILAASYIIPILPYLLSFAAGSMLYVVVEELIPEMSEGEHSNVGTLMFTAGFTLMMVLDVALA